MKFRYLSIVAVCFLIGSWSFADLSDKWGKGEKQEDGTTVYKRTFEVPASYREPNDVTNYFVDLEYTKLQIAETNGGKCLHVLCFDQEKNFQENTRQMTVECDSKKRIQKMSFSLGNYYYIDLDGDGKLDLFHDHVNNRSFIMIKDQLLRVFPKPTKDQDVQTSFEDKAIYKHQNGEWVKQETRYQKDIIEYRINVAKEIFFSYGKYNPNYKTYLTDSNNYESGFNDGMVLTISMESSGTDIKLKEALKSVDKKPKSYALGFYSALESYSAISKYIYLQNQDKNVIK